LAKPSDLTNGAISLGIVRLAGPMVFGLVAVLSQNLVDTYFVGQLGTVPLAALSFTFPVALTFTSLSIGLSAGASSLVSRVIGSGRREQARAWVTNGLVLSAMIVGVLSFVGWLTIEPLFSLLGASDSALEYIHRYMPLWYLSMPFLVVGIVGHGAMRADGDGKWPAVFMVISGLINIGLTPVLMQGLAGFPRLGIEGVALATLIARVALFVSTVIMLHYFLELMTLKRSSFDAFSNSARRILRVAVPAGAGNMANPIGIAIVTAILAANGDVVVAAFGVATRIEAFACLPMLALSSAIGPFAGQNWGAGKIGRIKRALHFCFLISAINAAVLILLFFFAGDWLAGLFASEEAVREKAVSYLLLVSFSLWGYGIVVTTAAAMNGIGRSEMGLAFYAIRMLVLYVPLAYLASVFADTRAVFIAIAVTNALAGLICAFWALRWLEQQGRQAVN